MCLNAFVKSLLSIFKSSHSSHTSSCSELFIDDQLEASGWSESSPNRKETLVESEWTFTLEDLGEAINETIIELSVSWLVHQSSSDEIEWRHCAGHEETSSESGQELASDTVFETQVIFDDSLACVIARHFGGVQDHSSHDVGLDSLVESSHTLGLVDFAGEESNTFCISSLTGHHSCLEDIEWVSGNGSNTSSQSTGEEFAQETGIFFVSSGDRFHWLVKTESQGGVRGFSHPSGTNTLVES